MVRHLMHRELPSSTCKTHQQEAPPGASRTKRWSCCLLSNLCAFRAPKQHPPARMPLAARDASTRVRPDLPMTTRLTVVLVIAGSMMASAASAQTFPDVQLTLNGAPAAVGTYTFPFPAGSTGLVLDNGLVRFVFNGKTSTAQTMLVR